MVSALIDEASITITENCWVVMAIPYGTRQIFDLQCEKCVWWECSKNCDAEASPFVGQLGTCAIAENGMPPLLSAHERCPGFEPVGGYPDYSEEDDEDFIWWGSSSEVLDLELAIKLIQEGRIERPGKQASANLPFQTVTVEGIMFLSQYEYANIGLAITRLSRPLSEVLVTWGVSVLRFLNPVQLDADGLEPFRNSGIEFNFWGGITGLNREVAQILATCTGSLLLPGITLSTEVAEALACCRADASLSLVGEHGHEVLRHLAQFQGERVLLTFDTPLDSAAMDILCSNPKRTTEKLERDDHDAFQVLSVLKR